MEFSGTTVAIVDEQGHERGLERIHDAGLFEGRVRFVTTPTRAFAFRRILRTDEPVLPIQIEYH